MPKMNAPSQNQLKTKLQAKTRARRRENASRVSVENTGAILTRNDLQPELRVVERPIDSIKPGPRRPRRTGDEQLKRVMRSIGEFQQVLPILIDECDCIVAGHIVWEAMRRLERATIQCIVVDHLTEAQRRAFAIAHNRISETGEWHVEGLQVELQELGELGMDLTITGLSIPELDIILSPPKPEQLDGSCEEAEELEPDPASVVIAGDLFALGDHRLLCADALLEDSYQALLGDDKAACVFSDPPYNCKIEGNVSGLGKHKHQDFAMAVGELSDDDFFGFLTAYLALCRAWTGASAAIFACMDWRQIDLLLLAGRAAGLARINMAVWNKEVGAMGSPYRSAHELIAVFCTGEKLAINNVELGKHGRDRMNVWTYPGANRRGSSAAKALSDHPTPKPVELVADALLDVTNPGDIVLDPFMGSGSTLIACQSTGRVARGIELDPKYVASTIVRWEKVTGNQAVHVESGLTYAELISERREASEAPA